MWFGVGKWRRSPLKWNFTLASEMLSPASVQQDWQTCDEEMDHYITYPESGQRTLFVLITHGETDGLWRIGSLHGIKILSVQTRAERTCAKGTFGVADGVTRPFVL